MTGDTAYGHLTFNRRQLLRWLIRGRLQIDVKINYKTQRLDMQLRRKP